MQKNKILKFLCVHCVHFLLFFEKSIFWVFSIFFARSARNTRKKLGACRDTSQVFRFFLFWWENKNSLLKLILKSTNFQKKHKIGQKSIQNTILRAYFGDRSQEAPAGKKSKILVQIPRKLNSEEDIS